MAALPRHLVIGTRPSRLALAQTDLVTEALRMAHGHRVTVEVRNRSTEGDRSQQSGMPLQAMAGRGVFVKDLEAMLLDGSADCLVHSLKDVTTDLAPGLALVAIPEREDPRDVLVSRGGQAFWALPAGARVATSSPRRVAQLAARRPDLRFVPIRGNVDTRLRKVDEAEVDAVVLAAAGLRRLGLEGRITEFLSPDVCMPDPGQGALALEARLGDTAVAELLRPLDHPPTSIAVKAERALLHALGGGCSLPVGALAHVEGATLTLQAVVCSPSGDRSLRRAASGPVADAEALGAGLANALLEDGARALLEVGSGV
jgi:hydroxymethylbilane synthase